MSELDKNIQKLILKAKETGNLRDLNTLLKENSRSLKGLVIDGYIGDYPTFLEPVFLKPGVKIGDTVLLGPNAYIAEGCELGAFSELANVIFSKNVITGKLTKLRFCVVDQDITLPDNFQVNNSFITKDKTGTLEIKSF